MNDPLVYILAALILLIVATGVKHILNDKKHVSNGMDRHEIAAAIQSLDHVGIERERRNTDEHREIKEALKDIARKLDLLQVQLVAHLGEERRK